jgi:hypothetical protein
VTRKSSRKQSAPFLEAGDGGCRSTRINVADT